MQVANVSVTILYLRTPRTWNLDASLNKQIPLSNGMSLAFNITATNVINHPVWGAGPIVNGIGLNFITDANITSPTFSQTPEPRNSPRAFFIRSELRF